MREYSKLGGYLSPPICIKLSDVLSGLVVFSNGQLVGWLQIVVFCGLVGNAGFTFTQQRSICRITAKSNAVLADGRLAMTAIVGMSFQDGPTGVHRLRRVGVLEARRLPVAILGHQFSEVPDGFVLGRARVCEGRQQGNVLRRRAVEIKHGRFSR